jgi:hypothetical protein
MQLYGELLDLAGQVRVLEEQAVHVGVIAIGFACWNAP